MASALLTPRLSPNFNPWTLNFEPQIVPVASQSTVPTAWPYMGFRSWTQSLWHRGTSGRLVQLPAPKVLQVSSLQWQPPNPWALERAEPRSWNLSLLIIFQHVWQNMKQFQTSEMRESMLWICWTACPELSFSTFFNLFTIYTKIQEPHTHTHF